MMNEPRGAKIAANSIADAPFGGLACLLRSAPVWPVEANLVFVVLPRVLDA
jgi:hypothetical protein